jgi:putative flippase GtrA
VAVARALYERFRQLIHEFAKFGVIGIVGVVITNGGYGLLHERFGVGPITSTTVATIVATAVSYLGNRYWTFTSRERTGVGRETVVFFVLNGVGLLIQDAVVGINAYLLGLQHNKAAGFIALNAGIGLATVFRFWSYRKWVWVAPPAETAGQGGGQPAPGGPTVTAPAAMPGGAGGVGPAVAHANGHAPRNGHLGQERASRAGSPLHG